MGWNELLWIAQALLLLSGTVLIFRLFGRSGLMAYVVLNTVLCNIEVLKIVELFGITSTLGNAIYGTTFLATDILSEFYGKKHSQKAVWLGFISLIMMTAVMQFAILMKPSPVDTASPHLEYIFGMMPRIAAASLTAYLVAQMHDVWAFEFWKKVTKGKHLWLRNNLSTMVSQAIDTVVFCTIAFVGLYDARTFMEILFTTYIFKWIVALLDTPFIYLARSAAKSKTVQDDIRRATMNEEGKVLAN
ncbi:queuosine precursor transporter [Pseudothermotoga thermarum]|uniref:Probable queuosine precursor transporter n=1 Tax=Pseudothermotoga thermarum DSM 5069 TaxID=688269 RepID=F7YUY3_9THEM|nr:queuosine precursor transporter [Pseudothermotoga thermarum]AEH51547.1 conserved hypothetical protein [Pseudothermotoga thermarum DSM 5069]